MSLNQKRGHQLPINDHILRHIKNKNVIRDPYTGSVIGCHDDAWSYREIDKNKLSVIWAEFYNGATFESIGLAIKAFTSIYKIRKLDVFSFSSIDSTINIAKTAGYRVKVIFTPTKINPAHSSIVGGRPDAQLEFLFARNCKFFISGAAYFTWEASVPPDSPASPSS